MPFLSIKSNVTFEDSVEMKAKALTFDLWTRQLPSFRLFPAIISLAAVSVIVMFLRKMTQVQIHTHFQIYCVLLAASDLTCSLSGFLTITGILKFIDIRQISIAESTTLMFFGLNSLNTHVLIALDRARSTLSTIRQNTRRQRSLINRPYILGTVSVSMLVSVAWTVFPFITGHPKYEMGFNDYYWSMDYTDSTRQARVYIVLLLTFQYFIPLITIMAIYAEILRRMVKQSRRAASVLKTRRITIICAVSTMAFILGWTPYAILTLISFFNYKPGLNFVFFANAAAKLSCVYNSLMFYCSTRIGKDGTTVKTEKKNDESSNGSVSRNCSYSKPSTSAQPKKSTSKTVSKKKSLKNATIELKSETSKMIGISSTTPSHGSNADPKSNAQVIDTKERPNVLVVPPEKSRSSFV